MDTSTKTSILIVEDDPHFRETLIDAMALHNVQAHGVMTGADAVAAIQDKTPSLILMDVQLPDTHGFDLCRRMKTYPQMKDVPIVFLSARYTEAADRAEGLLAGAEAYLSKPVNLDVLWEEVNYLLDKKH